MANDDWTRETAHNQVRGVYSVARYEGPGLRYCAWRRVPKPDGERYAPPAVLLGCTDDLDEARALCDRDAGLT